MLYRTDFPLLYHTVGSYGGSFYFFPAPAAAVSLLLLGWAADPSVGEECCPPPVSYCRGRQTILLMLFCYH